MTLGAPHHHQHHDHHCSFLVLSSSVESTSKLHYCSQLRTTYASARIDCWCPDGFVLAISLIQTGGLCGHGNLQDGIGLRSQPNTAAIPGFPSRQLAPANAVVSFTVRLIALVCYPLVHIEYRRPTPTSADEQGSAGNVDSCFTLHTDGVICAESRTHGPLPPPGLRMDQSSTGCDEDTDEVPQSPSAKRVSLLRTLREGRGEKSRIECEYL